MNRSSLRLLVVVVLVVVLLVVLVVLVLLVVVVFFCSPTERRVADGAVEKAMEEVEEKEEVVPLKDVIKERETRKLRFDTMLTALENKHEQEKEKAEKLNSKLNEQIAELMARLENSEKQISTLTLLTQAQRDKDRDFNGRETT